MSRALLCLVLATAPCAAAVAGISVPVQLDYAVIRAALVENVFVGVDESLHALTDTSTCNSLTMARPQLSEGADGNLKLQLDVHVTGGAPVGDLCVLPFEWRGQIELIEQAYLDETPGTIAFRVVDSRLLTSEGEAGVPGLLWTWVKQFGQPPLEAFRLDLAPLLEEVDILLAEVLPDAGYKPAVAPARFAQPVAIPRALRIDLEIDLPVVPVIEEAPLAPLSAAELAAWDERWQAWDAFATWSIKTFATDADEELRTALRDTLLHARYELNDALAEQHYRSDPVRTLFADTWTRLAPLIAAQARHDSTTALRYIAFVSAGDALRAIDAGGAQFGIKINRNALLQLARALRPAVDASELDYTLEPDPELRKLFGFPPQLEALEAASRPSLFGWLVAEAVAEPADAGRFAELNEWIPGGEDTDEYLDAVDALISSVLSQEAKRGKVPKPVQPIYDTLYRATAWQESCWRQFVERRGELQPIRSRAGSIGLMQVNLHVWRGVYDVAKLGNDIAYNARAGNEILVHYLVDYAIKNKENEITGSDDNLARATYAVYNGGPKHLSRYRKPETKQSLRAIDEAFWRKYGRIRQHGTDAVRQCYAE